MNRNIIINPCSVQLQCEKITWYTERDLFWILKERDQDWLSRRFFDQDVYGLILLVYIFKHNTHLLHDKGKSYANYVESVFLQIVLWVCSVFRIAGCKVEENKRSWVS